MRNAQHNTGANDAPQKELRAPPNVSTEHHLDLRVLTTIQRIRYSVSDKVYYIILIRLSTDFN